MHPTVKRQTLAGSCPDHMHGHAAHAGKAFARLLKVTVGLSHASLLMQCHDMHMLAILAGTIWNTMWNGASWI